MAGASETVVELPETRSRFRSVPRIPLSIWFPICVFALMRMVDAVFIMLASRHQIALTTASRVYYVHTPTPADPGYWSIITNWDGQWYEQLASNGYVLPDGSGSLEAYFAANAFNFLPLFPLLCGLLMAITGLGFAQAASIVSLASGAAAMVVLFKVIEHGAGRFVAACGVALVCTFVSAPVLQIAYKESLTLLLLLLWFWCVQQHRYWWAMVAVLALCFAKYLTPPIALVMAAHALDRWRHRSEDAVRRSEWLGMATIVGVSATGLFAWGTFVRLWLGDDADRILNRASVATLSESSFGAFGELYEILGWGGLAIPLLLVVVLALYAHTQHARSWGTELRTWLWAYPAYILAGAHLAPAMLRYLILAFPLLLVVVGSPAPGTTPRPRLGLVIACCAVGIALQWWWIDTVLILRQPGGTFWAP